MSGAPPRAECAGPVTSPTRDRAGAGGRGRSGCGAGGAGLRGSAGCGARPGVLPRAGGAGDGRPGVGAAGSGARARPGGRPGGGGGAAATLVLPRGSRGDCLDPGLTLWPRLPGSRRRPPAAALPSGGCPAWGRLFCGCHCLGGREPRARPVRTAAFLRPTCRDGICSVVNKPRPLRAASPRPAPAGPRDSVQRKKPPAPRCPRKNSPAVVPTARTCVSRVSLWPRPPWTGRASAWAAPRRSSRLYWVGKGT